MSDNEMRSLVDRLNETAYQYYVLDNPTISDKEWDAMYDRLVKLEKQTGVVFEDAPTRRVGGDPLPAFEQHRHLSRLWSMDKAQSIDEVRAWANRATARGTRNTAPSITTRRSGTCWTAARSG